jgi:hypothetical protein
MAVAGIVPIQRESRYRPNYSYIRPGAKPRLCFFSRSRGAWLALMLAGMTFDAAAYPSQTAQPWNDRVFSWTFTLRMSFRTSKRGKVT